ncbi:hypothetical protein [Flavobacterium fluviatile]|uniref:hypothetical protein n=1 Tax=Flavobacterium fluviatile TaxID=1862387 RepID=UPI0013CFF147|nr:hypothetical protein [Flavobacterium fluviatile]
MDEKLIDAILNDIYNNSEYILEESDIVRNDATQIQYREIVSFLCENAFIRQPFKNHGKLTILEKGNEVIRSGGWKKYLDIEQQAKERNTQKAIYDARISKFQATYGKYSLPISAIALLVAIGSLIVGILMYQSRIKELEMKQEVLERKIYKIDSVKTISKQK